MKKIAVLGIVAIVLLLAAAVGTVYWKRLAPISIRPDALAPAGTLVLVEAVDLRRTALRWQGTALQALWNEPEVQAFLEKPLATFPPFVEGARRRQELMKLWPRQLFAAVVAMDGRRTTWLAGFSFAGDQKVADRWLTDVRKRLKNEHPAGRAEITLHGRVEIETYTEGEFVLAETTHKGWHLAANDLAVLQASLDRLDSTPHAGGDRLAGDADYQKAFGALPKDGELRIFARTGVFAQRLLDAASAAEPGQTPMLEGLRQQRALAAVSKIEGKQLHDAVQFLSDAAPGTEPLGRTALALTTPETAFYYTTKMEANGPFTIPAEVQPYIPYLSLLERGLRAAAAAEGSGPQLKDVPSILGPEIAVVIPRQIGASGALAIAVRDRALAQKLADVLASKEAGDEAWTAREEGGLRLYEAPDSGSPLSINPVLTLTAQHLILSTSESSLLKVAFRPVDTPTLESAVAYRELSAQVVPPTESFAFLDLGGLLGAWYATLRPALALGAIGSEGAGEYFDLGKLPSAPVLSRHLGAFVASHGAASGGTLWESRGSVSPALLLAAGAAAWMSLDESKLPSLSKVDWAATLREKLGVLPEASSLPPPIPTPVNPAPAPPTEPLPAAPAREGR